MQYYELDEGKNTSSIVVDIQPSYELNLKVPRVNNLNIFRNAAKFLNRQKGPILMFVNADETGMTDDSIHDIKVYWEEKLGFTNWDNVTINDKGFGYLRGWMDHKVPNDVIIKAIRLMYAQKVTDSRDLFGGDESKDYAVNMDAALGFFYDWMILDPISVEWTSVAQLKRFNGSYIFGGACKECLKEVQLLMNAFNIKYKVIEDFVYG